MSADAPTLAEVLRSYGFDVRGGDDAPAVPVLRAVLVFAPANDLEMTCWNDDDSEDA